MNRFTSLLWKEWREAQPFLWIGLGLFLGLPAVGGLEHVWHTARRFELQAMPLVVPLGGVLAVFVAVGVTTRDRRPKLEDFWRSRPIRVGPWLAIKYAVALAVVLVACELPLVADMATVRAPDTSAALLTFFPVYLTAIFSLAFLAGCLIDRPAHAATLGLAGMLLLYAAPVVVPPLRWMSVADFIDDAAMPARVSRPSGWLHLWGGRQVRFAGGMLGLSAASALVAVGSVARGWRVESGRRTLYGLLAMVFLLLFTSAAFQLATNLPVLQRAEIPPGEQIQTVLPSGAGGGGQVISRTYTHSQQNLPPGYYDNQMVEHDWSRSFQVTPNGLTLSAPVEVDPAEARVLAWPNLTYQRHGRFAYSATGDDPGPKDVIQHFHLEVYGDLHWDKAIVTQPLWDQPARHGDPTLYVWHGTLYAFGDRLQTFDIGGLNGVPQRTADLPLAQPMSRRGLTLWRDRRLTIKLLPLPGMPSTDRLAATVWFLFPTMYGTPCFDGRLLCLWGDEKDGTLIGYRLARADDSTATFDEIGRFRPTLLQRWASGFSYGRLTLADGRVYIDGLGSNGTLNAGVTILDTAGDRPLREVGHFAAPGAEMIRPLPDGRAIVTGENKLWLVGPPPNGAGG